MGNPPASLVCNALGQGTGPQGLNLLSDVAIDMNDSLWVVGLTAAGVAELHRSNDDGSNWTRMDWAPAVTFASNHGATALPRVTVDGCNNVHWTSQEPRDGGTNWVVRTRSGASGNITVARIADGSWPSNVAVATDGALFCAGALGADAGIVLSTDHGDTWTEISSVAVSDIASEPTVIVVTPGGSVVSNVSGDGPMSWSPILATTDGGGSWRSNVTTLRAPAQSAGAAVSPTGRVFLSGGLPDQWEVRADLGTWSIVDSLNDCAASGMFANELGIFSLGNCLDGGPVLRVSSSGSSWSSVPRDGGTARFLGVAADPSGRVIVVGNVGDAGALFRATCTN